jgi:hypothetical protein
MTKVKAVVAAHRSLLPTWKWWTGTVTAAGTIATAAFTGDGINTDNEKILVIGLITQRLITYLTPNSER